MKITDIIRGILDLTDAAMVAQQPEEPEVAVVVGEPEVQPEEDLLAVIQQLAGIEEPCEPEYANAPVEIVSPIGAAFPGGDGESQRKNPADIRTNAPSMYPGYQAEKR